MTSIELGSYKENFLVRMVFGSGEDAERKIEELRQKLGLKEMNAKTLIGFLLAAALVYGAYLTLKPGSPSSVHIENSFNTIGREMNLKPEEVMALMEEAINNKEDLKKHVVKLAHPGGVSQGGEIRIDGNDAFTIPAEIVNGIPTRYEKKEAEEPFQDFDNVTIVLRAMDLDRPTTGWWAIVGEISDKRLPVEISADINPATIPIGKNTPVDITVVYKVDSHGNKTPKRYLLRKLAGK